MTTRRSLIQIILQLALPQVLLAAPANDILKPYRPLPAAIILNYFCIFRRQAQTLAENLGSVLITDPVVAKSAPFIKILKLNPTMDALDYGTGVAVIIPDRHTLCQPILAVSTV